MQPASCTMVHRFATWFWVPSLCSSGNTSARPKFKRAGGHCSVLLSWLKSGSFESNGTWNTPGIILSSSEFNMRMHEIIWYENWFRCGWLREMFFCLIILIDWWYTQSWHMPAALFLCWARCFHKWTASSSTLPELFGPKGQEMWQRACCAWIYDDQNFWP